MTDPIEPPDDADVDYPFDGEPEPEDVDEALVGPVPEDDGEDGDE